MQALAEAAGLASIQRSRAPLPPADADIYVADTIGELGLFYRLAGVAFLGGSLVRHGGQNPIEAAKLGAVVLHGPHTWNFGAVYAGSTPTRAPSRWRMPAISHVSPMPA